MRDAPTFSMGRTLHRRSKTKAFYGKRRLAMPQLQVASGSAPPTNPTTSCTDYHTEMNYTTTAPPRCHSFFPPPHGDSYCNLSRNQLWKEVVFRQDLGILNSNMTGRDTLTLWVWAMFLDTIQRRYGHMEAIPRWAGWLHGKVSLQTKVPHAQKEMGVAGQSLVLHGKERKRVSSLIALTLSYG